MLLVLLPRDSPWYPVPLRQKISLHIWKQLCIWTMIVFHGLNFFFQPDSGIKVKELLVVKLTHRCHPLHQVWDPKTFSIIKIEEGPHLPGKSSSWHRILRHSSPPELLGSLSLLPGQTLTQCTPLDLFRIKLYSNQILSLFLKYFFYDLVIGGGHLVVAQVNGDLTSENNITVTGKQKNALIFTHRGHN